MGIKVTEDDPITDDVAVITDASGTGTLPFVPVDYEAIGIQFHSLSVSVEEVGVFTSSKTATLTFNFEVDLQEIGTRFVFNVSERGWLSIRHEDELTSPKVLPYALKVKITEVKDGREYFIIEEGRLKGHKASVKLADDGGSFLTKENLHTDSVNFIYHQENMVLEVVDTGRIYWAKMDEGNPIPIGAVYDIAIPYEPHHDFGEYYERYSIHAKTWFRLGQTDEDRFLHLGRVSAGCITVSADQNEGESWEEIYDLLITARKGDLLSVGTVKVIN